MRFAIVMALGMALVAAPAFGRQAEPAGRQTAETADVVPSAGIFDYPLYLSLNTGLINYEGLRGEGESRFLTALLLDWNVAATNAPRTPIQYGAEFGLLYSHVSSPGATFFGAAPESGGAAGANLFIVPANVWAAYAFPREVLVSLHTGANLYLRTDARSMQIGRNDGDPDGSADFFPNIGLKGAWGIGKNVALTLRGDWTLSPTDTIFVGMVGATIPIA